MAGLQLYGGLNVPERFITGLQADSREQSQASGAWCIFNPFVPACMGERKRAVQSEKSQTSILLLPFHQQSRDPKKMVVQGKQLQDCPQISLPRLLA